MLSVTLITCPLSFGLPAMSQPLHILVTHAGAFHSDEIMAGVLLERFYLARPLVHAEPSSTELLALLTDGTLPRLPSRQTSDGLDDERTPVVMVRTRAADALALARANPNVFVIDVGGELNPAQLNFDHHQASMQATWEDGTPFSSTGLVWQWLRSQGHLAHLADELLDELEASLIRPLDAHDNGQALFPLSQVCEGYNRHSDFGAEQPEQFQRAWHFLSEALDNHFYQAEMKVQARQTLQAGWELAQSRGERHVVLEEALAYPDGTGLLKEISQDQAELLAIPGRGNRFNLISLPIEDRFSIKCPVPEAWRGLMDETVEVEGHRMQLVFAHKTGFMCVVQGGPNEAHRLARHIVAHNDAYKPKPRRPGP